jgi:hypothetical protein
MNKSKKQGYMQRRQKEVINKKAIIWVGSIILALVILMTVLLIWNP